MIGPQSGPPNPVQPKFSDDGFWWWDGVEWRAAYSHDRLWRWTGQGWVPARSAPPAGSGRKVGLTFGLVGGFVGILVLVALIVAAILYETGGQVTNVFSSVVAGVGA
jgi:hypothetical protein